MHNSVYLGLFNLTVPIKLIHPRETNHPFIYFKLFYQGNPIQTISISCLQEQPWWQHLSCVKCQKKKKQAPKHHHHHPPPKPPSKNHRGIRIVSQTYTPKWVPSIIAYALQRRKKGWREVSELWCQSPCWLGVRPRYVQWNLLNAVSSGGSYPVISGRKW